MNVAFGPMRGGGGVGDICPLSVAFASSARSGYNIAVRAFSKGVAIRLGGAADQVALGDLRALAKDLEGLGVEALLLEGGGDVEAITVAASLASVTNLVLIPVVSTADRRVASIVTKRATTLALLARDRAALIFRAPSPADTPRVLESVEVAVALLADGPIDYSGPTLEIRSAYNEPRPDGSARLALGAWIEEASPEVLAVSDLVVMSPGAASAARARKDPRLVDLVSSVDLDADRREGGPIVLDASRANAHAVRALAERLR